MKKTVLITGGTSDLGYSIIREFANNDWDIIFTYNTNENRAKDICDELSTQGVINSVRLDLQNESNINELLERVDKLDCLVNCAAYNYDCDIFEHTKENFLKVLDINLVGPFLMSKYSYKLLNKTNGNIVNIASMNGINSMYPESIDYDASKAGLINLTKNLSRAFAPNIRVNAVAPGWIDTKNTEDMNPTFKKSEIDRIALKRFARQEEIAKIVYFLASDDASYINGSVICADGGRI